MTDKDPVDLINYKGIYFDDDSGQKYQCPESGAHFEYLDMFRRLKRIANSRSKSDISETEANKTPTVKKSSLKKLEQPQEVVIAPQIEQ